MEAGLEAGDSRLEARGSRFEGWRLGGSRLRLEARGSRLEAGVWRLTWRLELGGRRVEAGGSRLEARGSRKEACPGQPKNDPRMPPARC